MSDDLQNELPLMKSYVQSNLGRALLPDTNTMLFMRFIAQDGQENLLWSLSFDTEIAKQKFGALEAQSAEEVVRELVRRVQSSGCSPGTHRRSYNIVTIVLHFQLFASSVGCYIDGMSMSVRIDKFSNGEESLPVPECFAINRSPAFGVYVL
jgi:hypothetical protein